MLRPVLTSAAALRLLVLAGSLVCCSVPVVAMDDAASANDAVAAAVPPALLRHAWVEYSTANFRVYTDLDADDAVRSVGDIERFARVVRQIVQLGYRPSPIPVEFWLCRDDESVRQLAGDRTLLGFMRPSPRASYLVATAEALDAPGGSPMLHEYVHLLMRSGALTPAQLDLPRWYDEGMAEFLATLRVQQGVVRFGAPNAARLKHLRARSEYSIALAQVLGSNDVGALPGARVADFYALSWILVHWLYAERWDVPGQRHRAIDDYLQRVSNGEDVRSAARLAFGVNVNALMDRLRRYADNLRGAPMHVVPIETFSGSDGVQIQSRALDRYESAYRLGYVAVAGNPELARALFALALQQRPGDVFAEMGLAVTDQFEQDFATGVPRARSVLARSPGDALLAQELADMLYEWCDSDAPPANCAELQAQAISLYEQILRSQPTRIEAHSALGAVLLDSGGDPVAAEAHLAQASAALSWSTSLVLQLGRAAMRQGDLARAAVLLQRAERWAENDLLRQRVAGAWAEHECLSALAVRSVAALQPCMRTGAIHAPAAGAD